MDAENLQVDESKLYGDESVNNGELTQDDVTAEVVGVKPEGTPPAATEGASGAENTTVIPEDLKNVPYVWRELFSEVSTDDYKLEIPKAIISRVNDDGTPLTEKQEYALLKETLKQHIKPTIDEDPFVSRYKIARMSKDFEYAKFMEQESERIRIMNLPSNDYLFMAFKQQGGKSEERPNGWTDEVITEHVSKMNPIERDALAEKLKNNYSLYIQQQDQKQIAEFYGEIKNNFEAEELENQKYIKDYISKMKNEKTIRGLSLGDAEKEEYFSKVSEYIKRDPSTGLNKLETYLQSNKNFERLMPFIVLDMEGKLDNYMTKRVEQVKKKIEENLGASGTPFTEGASGSGEVDWNKLME
jgi:hypothetical protein